MNNSPIVSFFILQNLDLGWFEACPIVCRIKVGFTTINFNTNTTSMFFGINLDGDIFDSFCFENKIKKSDLAKQVNEEAILFLEKHIVKNR